MRRIVVGVLLGGLLVFPIRALAASACTAWLDLKGMASACPMRVMELGKRAGYSGNLAGETVYFWFGDNVVGVRCIGAKSVIALFAYHQKNDQACPLSDLIRDAIDR
jgi:hypothetical protein